MSPSFSDLGVDPQVVARLHAQGIDEPFPIQAATIADSLAGRDVCGRAPTGSGKTLAFGVAVVARSTGSTRGRPRALVLVPTRELASQVQRELGMLAGDGRRIIAVYGGTGYGPTRTALQRGVDVVVACPGRLEDLVESGSIDLSAVNTVVLDEADRMADMGFLPAVRRLLDVTASGRQLLLFSATLGTEIETLVKQYQTNPARHDVVGHEDSAADVEHLFWHTDRDKRVAVAADLVGHHGQALIFCRTKHGADRVARQLKALGVEAVAIHGDRSQSQRERALAVFSQGRARALVATDVAARGIHVEQLPCVIHFDLPADHTDYLHRSGRTGRAGSTGTVVSLVVDDQKAAVRTLQRRLGFPEQVVAAPPVGSLPKGTFTPPTPRPERATPASYDTGSSNRDGSGSPRPRRAGSGREHRPGNRRVETARPAAVADPGARRGERHVARPDHRRHEGKARGTVKFFNADKGYGFVERSEGEDLFFHHTSIVDPGVRTLGVGQKVAFEMGAGRKGAEAKNLRVL